MGGVIGSPWKLRYLLHDVHDSILDMTCICLGSLEQHVWVQRSTAFSNSRKGRVHDGVFKVKRELQKYSMIPRVLY